MEYVDSLQVTDNLQVTTDSWTPGGLITQSGISRLIEWYDNIAFFLKAQPDLILILDLALNLCKYFKQIEWIKIKIKSI